MTKCSIYHNPRCSKSRQTLALIEDQGIEPEVILYLEKPPSATRLDAILKQLGKEPLEIMRVGEQIFKDLGLSKTDDRPRKEWIKLMVRNPVLMERPIVVNGTKAALGRPPESVLEIL